MNAPGVKPVLAWLRPDQTLAEYEMDYVRLLGEEFDLRVLTSGNPAIGGLPPEARRLIWPDEFTWHGRRRSLLNAVFARVFGRRYHLPGLAPMLAGAAIVQAGELASECSYQAARLKERLGFRLCLSISENNPLFLKRSRNQREQMRFTLTQVDHALAISLAAAGRLAEAGFPKERITVTGHGIDCARFTPPARPRGGEGQPVRVGYCGRFRAEKGLEVLLKAARDLDVECVLLGDGPDRDRLEDAASRRTLFLPPLPYDRMHTFYHSLDIFVLPSIPLPGLVEQFGFVLLEAMASGLAVVTTPIGGIPEVVGDAAVMVPSRDVLALKKALQELAANPERRRELGERGRERVRKLFSREAVADRMRAVFRRLLAEKSPLPHHQSPARAGE